MPDLGYIQTLCWLGLFCAVVLLFMPDEFGGDDE
jgi:hypothetical protein